MPTTAGCLEPPLGNTRLQTCRLMSSLLLTNTHSINVELAQLGTIGLLLVSSLYFFVRCYLMPLHKISFVVHWFSAVLDYSVILYHNDKYQLIPTLTLSPQVSEMDSSVFESGQNHCSKQGSQSKTNRMSNSADPDETAHYERVKTDLFIKVKQCRS